ncbi:MAG: methyltransferase [Christensenellaceae bacterium]
MDIRQLYKRYEQSADEKERLALIKELERYPSAFFRCVGNGAWQNLQPRPLAYALSLLSKKERYRESIRSLLDEGLARELALSQDAKSRKYLYVLLGNVAEEKYFPLLQSALADEATYYVLPSLILAVGNYEGKESVLCSYQERLDLTDVPEKIVAEIESAFSKAFDKLGKRETVAFSGFSSSVRLLFTAMPCCKSILKEDLADYAIDGETEEGFLIRTRDLASVYRIRTFYDCYLYDESLQERTMSDVCSSLSSYLRSIGIFAMHSDAPVLRYRITTAEFAEKKELLAKTQEALHREFPDRFVNSPSNYSLEFVLRKRKDRWSCLIRLCAFADPRYAYRKEDLPASISPTTAAILARIALGYQKHPARMLDPFCGTSTLPIELHFLAPNASLTGVDISENAIEKSRINSEAASVPIQLVHSDILRYRAEKPFDLVVSNLPFGARVGTHASNERLYREFVSQLPALLSDRGIACLYTTEIRLLSSLLKESGALRLIKTIKMESGGLNPSAFIVKKS